MPATAIDHRPTATAWWLIRRRGAVGHLPRPRGRRTLCGVTINADARPSPACLPRCTTCVALRDGTWAP